MIKFFLVMKFSVRYFHTSPNSNIMRKTQKLSSSVMVMLMIMMMSCFEGTREDASYGILNPGQLAKNLWDISNKNKPPFIGKDALINNYRIGEIRIFTTNSKEVVIALKSPANEHFSDMFVLQTKDIPDIDINFDEAEVIFTRQSALINSLSSPETFYFQMESEISKQLINSIPSEIISKAKNNDNVFSGYGWTLYLNGEFPLENDFNQKFSSIHSAMTSKFKDASNSSMFLVECNNCTYGGPGSEACGSSSGGWVYCSSGYYACCDSSSAKCCQNDTGVPPGGG